MRAKTLLCLSFFIAVDSLVMGARAQASPPAINALDKLPSFLQDRDDGIPTSMYGTYVRQGQFLILPFYEYTTDNNHEYQPAKLGYGVAEDFRGRLRISKEQIFLAYGISERVAFELEAASIEASLEKSASDNSTMPAKVSESGLGDIEAQVRVRLRTENEHRPEIFGFFEVTAPTQKSKPLTGDRVWDFKPGLGLIRGYTWGTMTVRTTLEYNHDDKHPDVGETAIEYLRRLSPALRMYLGVEGGETGAPDEWEFNSGINWRLSEAVSLKYDNILGITSKATDWSPQLGLLISFGG